jgi:hypothetical protein
VYLAKVKYGCHYSIHDHIGRMVNRSRVLQQQLTMMAFFDVTKESIRGRGNLGGVVREVVASLPLEELAFVLVDVSRRSFTKPGHVGLNVRLDLSYGMEVINYIRGELDVRLGCTGGGLG